MVVPSQLICQIFEVSGRDTRALLSRLHSKRKSERSSIAPFLQTMALNGEGMIVGIATDFFDNGEIQRTDKPRLKYK